MSTKTKKEKPEVQKLQTIDSKELSTIKNVFETLNKVGTDIALLEVNKSQAVQKYIQIENELKAIQDKLTYKYGSINLNMSDGSYTVVKPEETNEPSNTED